MSRTLRNVVRKPLAQVCDELVSLQRQRVMAMKSRIMGENRLRAQVAGTIGYTTSMEDDERKKLFAQASAVIDGVIDGTADSPIKAIIEAAMIGIEAFYDIQDTLEKGMKKLVKQLPVYEWVEDRRQLGFGDLTLGIVVGEAGNLDNYSVPCKLWKRFGCAPYTFDDKTLMGATWMSGKEGKLPKVEWEKFGYSPRRRSIAFLIGEGLVKQNGEGPYRRRWLEAKLKAYEIHKEDEFWDWKPCDKCKSKDGGHTPGRCETCGGMRVKCQRAHRHGMLCATKKLLKNLWNTWQKMR